MAKKNSRKSVGDTPTTPVAEAQELESAVLPTETLDDASGTSDGSEATDPGVDLSFLKIDEAADRTDEAFNKIIRKHSTKETGLKLAVLTIDAVTAARILHHFNEGNRPKSKALANEYAGKFLRGVWSANGEPLIFGRDDEGNVRLISGQHRLSGLVQANKTYLLAGEEAAERFPNAQLEFPFPVVYGVDENLADSVDTGKARKHVDVLFRSPVIQSLIDDENNKSDSKRKTWSNHLSVAARLCWLRLKGSSVAGGGKFDIEEMVNFIAEDNAYLPRLLNVIMDIDRNDGGNRGLRMSLGYITALVYVACYDAEGTYDDKIEAKILDSLRSVAAGTDLKKGSPEHALSAYWNKLTSTPGSKHRDFDWVGPFVNYLNWIISGEQVKLPLSAKQVQDYATNPPLIVDYDTACYEAARS